MFSGSTLVRVEDAGVRLGDFGIWGGGETCGFRGVSGCGRWTRRAVEVCPSVSCVLRQGDPPEQVLLFPESAWWAEGWWCPDGAYRPMHVRSPSSPTKAAWPISRRSEFGNISGLARAPQPTREPDDGDMTPGCSQKSAAHPRHLMGRRSTRSR